MISWLKPYSMVVVGSFFCCCSHQNKRYKRYFFCCSFYIPHLEKKKKRYIYFEANLDAGGAFSRIMEHWLELIISWLTCFGDLLCLCKVRVLFLSLLGRNLLFYGQTVCNNQQGVARWIPLLQLNYTASNLLFKVIVDSSLLCSEQKKFCMSFACIQRHVDYANSVAVVLFNLEEVYFVYDRPL